MRKKILITLGVCIAVGAFALNQCSLTKEIEEDITDELTERGFSDVNITLKELDQHHALFSHIAFKKGKVEVVAKDINIIATTLPVPELLHGNYNNVKIDWQVGSLAISGIPYPLPPIIATGHCYIKDGKPLINGEMHDEKRANSLEFTVTSARALLEHIHMTWKDSALKSDEVVIGFGHRKPVHIPLTVENMPLNTLLTLISDKAHGTGIVSGHTDLIIYRDNSFTLSNGKFTASEGGVIQLTPDILPGDAEQVAIARQALSNFHYKNLNLLLDSAKDSKMVIRLKLEGNNPDAFDGRPIKLNVNLSGDVLQLLQQSILTIADPQKLIEEGTR